MRFAKGLINTGVALAMNFQAAVNDPYDFDSVKAISNNIVHQMSADKGAVYQARAFHMKALNSGGLAAPKPGGSA